MRYMVVLILLLFCVFVLIKLLDLVFFLFGDSDLFFLCDVLCSTLSFSPQCLYSLTISTLNYRDFTNLLSRSERIGPMFIGLG